MSNAPLILLADDSQISRELLANTLKAAGYNVIQAIDGGSAMKVVKEHKIALAVIDHYMAPHGGLEFARQLQNDKISLPMIMVTNEETSDLLLETTRYGISGYMRKPVDQARFLELVRRTLRAVPTEKKHNVVSQTIKSAFTPDELMEYAIELANKNAQAKNGGPFAAVVADQEGRILGEGANGITSRSDPVAHAEVMAIRQATERLNKPSLEDCVLYTSSEPTSIGKALIESVGLGKVYYGLSHQDMSQFMSFKKTPPVPYEQLKRDEALEMLQNWKSQ